LINSVLLRKVGEKKEIEEDARKLKLVFGREFENGIYSVAIVIRVRNYEIW
jgi:hypothetical protein